jgi:aryl-alcohol dehydrogenase-like predicted oxidoreductase
MPFNAPRRLGRTGLSVGPLGLGAGYGAPSAAFEEAFARGCNYFYWASRKPGMSEAIRNLVGQGHRDSMVIAVQSYTRSAWFLERSLRKALAELGIERADVFLLGWHNRAPSQRILDRALALKEAGLFAHLGLSGHNRSLFPKLHAQGRFDVFHVRYNAAHRGAETETFPHLQGEQRPGLVTYTATRWGQLLKASKMPPGEPPLSAADCYRFSLSHPAVDVCLTGPRSVEQMRQGLAALEAGPLSADELARISRIGAHVHG